MQTKWQNCCEQKEGWTDNQTEGWTDTRNRDQMCWHFQPNSIPGLNSEMSNLYSGPYNQLMSSREVTEEIMMNNLCF